MSEPDNDPHLAKPSVRIIPIVEERVELAKRVREGRTVTVTTRPVTETVTISEPVTREHISVERVPVGRVIEAVPTVREEGDLTVIPVVEERVTVTVELMLTEEIHLLCTHETALHEETIALRRTEVDIDADGEPRQRGPTRR